MAAPKRELFKAAEVCEVVQVQPYVLRSWEAEFPQIGQAPAGGGPRLYRRADVEMVLRIKSLVFGEGLTLAGARRRLEEDGEPTAAAGDAGPGRARRRGAIGCVWSATGCSRFCRCCPSGGTSANCNWWPPPAPEEEPSAKRRAEK